jgi:beta-mannanase
MSSKMPRYLRTPLIVVAAALALAITAQTHNPGPSTGSTTASDSIANQAAKTCGVAGKFAPKCGAYWGVYSVQNGNPEQSITRLESQVGRKFDITSRYHDFSNHQLQGQFPDQYERRLGQTRRLFFSWQARVSDTNKNISWRAIANGSYDKFVNSAATRVKAYKRPVFIAFDAEFDAQKNKGTMADYVAAYRHIFNVFKAHAVTNVAWAWVSTGYVGGGNGARILKGYPGDAYVNWVGWDPYNFYRCNGTGWKTFAQKVTPTYNWMKAHGHGNKPFLLSEYGTQYDKSNAARSKAWHSAIPGALKSLPNLKALVRFDANGYFGAKKCNFYIKNGTGSLTSFAQAGRAVKTELQP